MIVKQLRQGEPTNVLWYASRLGKAKCVGGSFPMDLGVDDLVLRLQATMRLRPDLKNTVLHTPVRLTDMDRELTDVEWGFVAQEVVKAHGLESTPWMAWTHPEGRKRESHLHIVGLTVEFDGTRIDLGHNYRTNQTIAVKLEKELRLWRAPRVKGGTVLPPVGVGAPVPLPSPGKYAFVQRLVRKIVTPGMTLPELKCRLAEHQVELVPSFAKDGLTISGLGFRWDDTFEIASRVDRTFSLKGLQKHYGITYDPARDLAHLVPPPAPIGAPIAVLPTPMDLEIHVEAGLLSENSTNHEVPRVAQARLPLHETFLQRARSFALDLWARIRIATEPQRLPRSGHLRLPS
jgi:hypothetical protein